MNCSICETNLSAFVDDELEDEIQAAMRVHIESCRVCEAAFFDLSNLRRYLRVEFDELKASAPAPPTPSPHQSITPKRLALAASILLVCAIAWLQSPQHSTPLTESEVAFLQQAASEALAEMADAPALLVRLPVASGDLDFRMTIGDGGAYLWQLRTDGAAPGTTFDPSRYLAGSDGNQLWASAPSQESYQTFPVEEASQQALPRLLALTLRGLSQTSASQNLITLNQAFGQEVLVEVAHNIGLDNGTVQLVIDRASGELLDLRFDLAGFQSLHIAALPGPRTADFSLAQNVPQLASLQASETLTMAEIDSEKLWNLGYVRGALLPKSAEPNTRQLEAPIAAPQRASYSFQYGVLGYM